MIREPAAGQSPSIRVDVLEALDERGPARHVVPERLRVGDPHAGERDRGARAAHQASSSRSRPTASATASSRGATAARRRSRSCSPAVRQRVEAPRAALGVLPLPRDQPARLEVAQQRVHRVRVDGEQPVADLGDALDQLVAVGAPVAEQVQHEQRQHAGAAQLARDRVGRAGAARPAAAPAAARAASSGAASATACSVSRWGIGASMPGPLSGRAGRRASAARGSPRARPRRAGARAWTSARRTSRAFTWR